MVYHDCYIFVVDAVIVDGRLKEMGVLFEPGDLLARFGVWIKLLTISACLMGLTASCWYLTCVVEIDLDV